MRAGWGRGVALCLWLCVGVWECSRVRVHTPGCVRWFFGVPACSSHPPPVPSKAQMERSPPSVHVRASPPADVPSPRYSLPCAPPPLQEVVVGLLGVRWA